MKTFFTHDPEEASEKAVEGVYPVIAVNPNEKNDAPALGIESAKELLAAGDSAYVQTKCGPGLARFPMLACRLPRLLSGVHCERQGGQEQAVAPDDKLF